MSNQVSEDVYGATASETAVPNKAWPISRYSRREGSSWKSINDGSGSYVLHTKVGQLMLIQNGTVLESLPLICAGQLHGVYRDDTLLIATRHQNVARKFKVAFESVQEAAGCVKFLRNYFPIKDMTKTTENVPVTVGQRYEQLVESDSAHQFPKPDPLPASFPLEETVRMCLLDPAFPGLVGRIAACVSRMQNSGQ